MLKQHILIELKQFISAIASHRVDSKTINSAHLARTSLHLLDDLPASREIVFDYFALVFDLTVGNYVATVGSEGKNPPPQVEDVCNDIQEALESLVTKGPPAWCPLIASWCLNLVGKLSDKYPIKVQMSIGQTCNFWINCSTMKGLLSLISSCFRKMTNTEAESCVETLLAVFQRFPISFDWVVARLGGCFPRKIISQILQCGLKKFVEDIRCHFDSEIGILDYLTYAHEKELMLAIHDLFEDGFAPKKSIHIQVVPFLTQIARCSQNLLQCIVSVFLEMYDDSLVDLIVRQSPAWLANKVFAELQPSFGNLIFGLKMSGPKILITVARLAEKYMWCQDFLEYNLQELEQIILLNTECPLVTHLNSDAIKYLLWKASLSTDMIEQQTAVRLLLFSSTKFPYIYHQTISELLRKSYVVNQSGIGALIRMVGGQNGVVEFPGIKQGIQMLLEDVLLKLQFHSKDKQSQALSTIQNLITLAKLEKKNILPYLKQQSIVTILNECFSKLLHILCCALTKLTLDVEDFVDMGFEISKKFKSQAEETEVNHGDHASIAHLVIELFNIIEAGHRQNVMSTPDVLKLASLTVKYFFWCLLEKSPTLRLVAANRAFTLFQRQCSARKSARAVCLRELVEGALFFHGNLFGGREEMDDDDESITHNDMLMYSNQKQTGGHNANRTVLHAGVIGKGLRPEVTNVRTAIADPELQGMLLKAIDSCCNDVDKPNQSYEGYSMVSLLLVEMVSTDIMYNGLPFPDEEFTKVTMERDLRIRGAFTTSPVLWALLGFIAVHRPALCFSSVLLRALCATCLHQWRARNVNKFQQIDKSDELMQCTINVLQIMALGQLLPPPLSNLHNVIGYFDAPEIALILKECVWNYLKDNVPSPVMFTCDSNALHWRNPNAIKVPAQYVDILRNIMQKKLSKLGTHYYQMFHMCEVDNPATESAEK